MPDHGASDHQKRTALPQQSMLKIASKVTEQSAELLDDTFELERKSKQISLLP